LLSILALFPLGMRATQGANDKSNTAAIARYGEEAKRLGATGVTESPTELFGLLNLEDLKSTAS